MTSKMLMFYVPDDRELLAALGEVTLRHEHLSHILKMTIKSIAGLSVAEALDATQYDGARQLRGSNRTSRQAPQGVDGQNILS
jgi:hypothetical protein